MLKACLRTLVLAACCALSLQAQAKDELIQLPTRDGQSMSYWWMPTEGAKLTVLLFPGGSGGLGMREGRPQSNNFLVRTRDLFREQGFNVGLIGNPSDKRQLDDAWRTSEMHRTDIENILKDLRQRGATQPVWLVGTSRGTVSATALGIGLPDQLAGLVLTSSITAWNVPTSVPRQALDQIRLPVLVYHHRQDGCRITQVQEVDAILRGLKNAPVKKRWVVEGGENPTGDPCDALHWHGFIGMEARAVQDLGGWIKNPKPD